MTKTQLELRKKELTGKVDAILNRCKTENRAITEEEVAEAEALTNEIQVILNQLKLIVTPKVEEEPSTPVEENEIEDDDEVIIVEEDEEEKSRKRRSFSKPTVINKRKRFSMLKTVRCMAEGRPLDEAAQAVHNAGLKEARRSGLAASGFCLPSIEKRASIQATVAGAGIENVPEEMAGLVFPDYADALVGLSGATVLSGLVGDLAIPVYSGTNADWATAENSTATDGAGTFTQLVMKPKRLTAFIDISKQFLAQDSNGAEALLQADLIGAIQRKLDATIFGYGAASATQPGGLFALTTPTAVTNYATFLAVEQSLLDVNAKAVKYLANPAAYAALRNLAKPDAVVTDKALNLTIGSSIVDSNTISGIDLVVNTNVKPAATGAGYLVGDFSNLLVGQWAGIDVVVDPYTRAKDAVVTLVVNAWYDAVLRKPTVASATL